MTGFFSLWLGLPCLTIRKSLRIAYSRITGEAVSVANWVLTGMSATQCPDGRRQKNLSAVCPRNAGALLWVFKYALRRSKQCLRHPFNYRELKIVCGVIHNAGIYSFLSLLFFLYSALFMSLILIVFFLEMYTKNHEVYTKNQRI